MNNFFTFLFLFIFFLGISQKREFKNQGEQENYWAEQVFEKEYQKQNYSKYKGNILIESNTQIIFGNKTLNINCNSDFLPIFTNGIFYPQLILGNTENNKILTNSELEKLTPQEQVFYKLGRNDLFNISELEELTFLNKNKSPTIKRFRFWSFWSGMANPQVYYFEITNENANDNTTINEFIKNSKLTFLKSGHIIL